MILDSHPNIYKMGFILLQAAVGKLTTNATKMVCFHYVHCNATRTLYYSSFTIHDMDSIQMQPHRMTSGKVKFNYYYFVPFFRNTQKRVRFHYIDSILDDNSTINIVYSSGVTKHCVDVLYCIVLRECVFHVDIINVSANAPSRTSNSEKADHCSILFCVLRGGGFFPVR